MVENYFHFLFVCPRLQAVRDRHRAGLPLLRDECGLQGSSRLAAFIAVSAQEGPPGAAEQHHLILLGAFLSQLFLVKARHVAIPPLASMLPRV